MDKLPENVKRIDILRIERNMNKLCKCNEPSYIVDISNRLVYCKTCGAIVDPFDALYKIALKHEILSDQVEGLLRQAKEIDNYKPHLKVFKRLESEYRSNKFSMVPICPNCNKPFDFKDLNQWVNRRFYEVQV